MLFLPAINAARSQGFNMDRSEAFQRLSSPRHTLAEVLRDGVITKIYLDYDHVLQGRTRESGPPSEDIIAIHLSMLKARLDHIQTCLRTSADAKRDEDEDEGDEEANGQGEGKGGQEVEGDGDGDGDGDEDEIRYVIAQRHGWCSTKKAWKISFRPFFLGLRIRYDHIMHILRVTDQLEAVPGQPSFWDMTVYKPAEQLLACINGIKKASDQRMLKAVNGSEQVLDYVAQASEDDWPLLTVPPQTVSRVVVETARPTCVVPVHVLRAIVTSLSVSRAADRKQWIETVWAIHAVSVKNGYVHEGEVIAQEFSGRCDAKYSPRRVTQAYESGRVGGSCIDIGSLLFWCKSDNSSSPSVFRRIQGMLAAAAPILVLEEPNMLASTSASASESSKSKSPQPDEASIRTTLMQQLASRWPDRFSELDQTAFQISFRDGTACFEDGNVSGYIKDYSVFLSDSTFLGLLCDNVPVKGPLNLLHREVPPSLNFLFNRETRLKSTLRAENPSDASISLYQHDTPGGRDFLEIDVKGRKTMMIDDPKKVRGLQELIARAVHRHLETIFGPQSGNFLFVNNGTIIVNAPPAVPDRAPADFDVIRDRLNHFAEELGLRRRDGIVYRPVEGCPCAYIPRGPYYTYERFVNEVLKDEVAYTSNPKRYDEAMKYITNYEITKFPWVESDRDILSFSNGVLDIVTGTFLPYADMDPTGETVRRVARHHLPHPYVDCCDTPLLDQILDAQFDREVAEIFCALLGRCLFRVNQLDAWQVMPFMMGVGGTGKSMLLNVVQQLFAPGTVGNLAAKREEVFGMANLVDKEIIMGRDMPAKMSASLPQEIMQAMTAGEDMEIPRKGHKALHVTWTASVVMAGNHMPDYTNTGNNIGRRMVTLRFDNVISTPQEDLQQRIMSGELPNIVCRFLKAYADLRVRVRQVGGFWKAVPPIMLDWRSKLSASTNKLEEFLTMDDDERGIAITHVEGRITIVPDFKAAFESKMGKGTYIVDPAVFSNFGYRMSDKRENVCKSCNQLARIGCCAAYSAGNRGTKAVIFDMVLSGICVCA